MPIKKFGLYTFHLTAHCEDWDREGKFSLLSKLLQILTHPNLSCNKLSSKSTWSLPQTIEKTLKRKDVANNVENQQEYS